MAIRSYRDLVLVADAADERRPEEMSVHVFDSPVGQSETVVQVPLPMELWSGLEQLDSRRAEGNLQSQVTIGSMLADALLPRRVREMLRRSLDRIADDEGLRIRLRLADSLEDLPWEYLYLQPAGEVPTALGFLALNPRLSVTRHEALPVPGDWFDAPAERRVVVAMASPEPYTQYGKLTSLPAEQRSLRDALGEVGGIRLDVAPDLVGHQGNGIPSATLHDLTTLLTDRADVFHFGGHGEFRGGRRGAGHSQILLGDASNRALPIGAEKFAALLRGRGIRLVVLGACETGRRDGSNLWSGVASALLGAEIPAVVAMQFRIRDDLASAFAASLYRGLVAGLTVDEAVSAGRLAMHLHPAAGDTMDWGIPVLYLRSPGGAVFNPVTDDASVQAAATATRQLVAEQEARVVAEGGTMKGVVIRSVEQQAGIAGQPIEVTQRITESVKGLVVGAEVFEAGPTGTITVHQEADTVEGDLIGLDLTGASEPESDATDSLRLRLQP